MNNKQWTKQEVLDLLQKKESDIPKEIEIDDYNQQVCFTLKLPFIIDFNQGHWKLFFKSEKEVWDKFEKDESFFGILGIFENELKAFLENICTQTCLTKDDIVLEKEERMYEYDKQRKCRIIQDGMQVDIIIGCKSAGDAANIISCCEKTTI